MTKAEFTPVANALESNIDAALARIRELEARAELLRAALEMVEWIDYGGHESGNSCPWCHAMRKDGHALDCARQAALSPEQPAALTVEGGSA